MKNCLIILYCVMSISAFTQTTDRGHLSGSFDSYTQFYQKDEKINAILPQDKVGSNNFLKLDYTYKGFSAGVQFESYLPSIAGYPFNINESKLINRYFKYTAKKISVQVGDFYEQFGSGLIYRSWENRQIGINNALEGINVQVTPVSFLHVKIISGKQRKIFDRANSVVRGADATIDFSKLSKKENPKARIEAGFSYVSRYQQYTGPDVDFPATVRSAAARLSISSANASLGLEYVQKGRDPSINNNQDLGNGKALLVNGSVAAGKFGLNLTLRSISNMDFRGERDAIATSVPVNFIPALTRPHDYLTTNIYVYNAQAQGEIGGQADIYYTIGKNVKKPSRIGINFSHYRSLQTKNNIFSIGDNAYFHDLSIEWKKKWNNKLSSVLAYHNLFYNKSVVEGGIYDNITANIVVLNTTYKYAAKKSFRFELQHLFTQDDNGNWAAAVTEFNFAPSFSFYVSDLYNYDVTNTHYPNIGGSFTKNGSRFSVAYGRQRAGLFCVGGICRFVPAATAITATLTITFNSK